MTAPALKIVEQIQAALSMEDVAGAISDESATANVVATLERLAEPDFETIMVASPSAGGGTLEGRGSDGFRDLWREWTEPFESFRIEVEKTIEAGDQVVSLVRITGRTKTGGVDIGDTSGAVWTLRNGKLARVEFHLDPESALRAAGLDT